MQEGKEKYPMPFFENRNVRLRYQIDGLEDGAWLILSNSLGTQLDMWAPQMSTLRKYFRILRYDTRGHGQSSVPPGPYTIPQLGEDVIALMDSLKIERAHFCGLSMGGMTGMWLGANHGERFSRLVLCNTSALIGPASLWDARIAKVKSEGMASITGAVIERWFTPEYQRLAPNEVNLVKQMLLESPPAGYVANCAAVRDMDLREALFDIRVPTLVIAGDRDAATPPEDSKLVADRIAGARYVTLKAAHLSNWEDTVTFNRELIGFLTEGA
jgi:3-oxoadipate enol-lactonase